MLIVYSTCTAVVITYWHTIDGGNSGVSGEQLHLTNVIPVSSTSALLVDILEGGINFKYNVLVCVINCLIVSENVDDIHTEGRADEGTYTTVIQ